MDVGLTMNTVFKFSLGLERGLARQKGDRLRPWDELIANEIAENLRLIKATSSNTLLCADDGLDSKNRLPCPWPGRVTFIFELLDEETQTWFKARSAVILQRVENRAKMWVVIKTDRNKSVELCIEGQALVVWADVAATWTRRTVDAFNRREAL